MSQLTTLLDNQLEAQREIAIRQTDEHIKAIEAYITYMQAHPEHYHIDSVTAWRQAQNRAKERLENMVPIYMEKEVAQLQPQNSFYAELLNKIRTWLTR